MYALKNNRDSNTITLLPPSLYKDNCSINHKEKQLSSKEVSRTETTNPNLLKGHA